MTKFVTIIYIFLFISYVIHAALLTSEDEDRREDRDEKNSHLWFGPRIGRRKRISNEEILKNLENSDVEYLVNFFRKNPWTIILLSTGKIYSSFFKNVILRYHINLLDISLFLVYFLCLSY